MKIIRYLDNQGTIHYGEELLGGQVTELAGDLFGSLESTGRPAEIQKRLAPFRPTQILAIGLNYRKHAEETNSKIPEYPVLFVKSPAAVQNPDDPIEIPVHLASETVDYECELAVVIGEHCKNVSRADALKYVLGYTCANDVSARDWQKLKGGGQWCRGKSFDTFCPLGPRLVTADEIRDPNTLGIRTVLNGVTVQESNTADMIFDVPSLIEFLSGSTTLLPGTVIMTGTPSGVGMAAVPPVWLKAGDQVSVEIDKIGLLSNPVILEPVS